MGRRPDLERRADILSRALQVLRERGVHGTSMTELAAALGVKRPTLYWYFKDVGDLFDAAFDEANHQALTAVTVRMADQGHTVDRLAAMVEGMVEHWQGRRGEIIVLFQLWAAGRSGDPAGVLARGEELLLPFRAGMIDLIEAGQARGEVVACDPEGVADAVLAVMHGALVHLVAREADLSPMLATVRERFLEPLKVVP